MPTRLFARINNERSITSKEKSLWKMKRIDVFQSVSQPTVISSTTITEWFNQIKSSEYTSDIINARNGLISLDKLKTKLPCVTYNFNYNSYKKDSNIIGSTGYIFIDIDNSNFDITSVDESKLTGYYRSIGGNGYHIVVSVKGITKDNFKPAYSYICNQLGIDAYVDTKAIKHSQFAIISHDSNAYINDNPFEFDTKCISSMITDNKVHQLYDNNVINTYNSNTSSNTKCISSIITVNKEVIYDRTDALRFDNTNEIHIPEGSSYVTDFDNGFEITKAFLIPSKLSDNRYTTLLAYATNLLFLNPNLSKERFKEILINTGNVISDTQIESSKIDRIVNSVYKYKEEGTLTPIKYRKKRKIIFDKKAKMTKEEKLDIVRTEVAINKINKSISKIESIITNWNTSKQGKISIRKISDFGISQNTIRKHLTANKYLNELFESKQTVTNKSTSMTNFITFYNYNLDTTGYKEVYNISYTANSRPSFAETISTPSINDKVARIEANEAKDTINRRLQQQKGKEEMTFDVTDENIKNKFNISSIMKASVIVQILRNKYHKTQITIDDTIVSELLAKGSDELIALKK
jgi:hypothetical protein